MLSSLRQTARSALPRVIPRYGRTIVTTTPADREALNNEARSILTSTTDPFAEPIQPVVQPSGPPKVDLDSMHHHIPPAESPLLQFLATTIMLHGEYARAQKTVSKMLLHIYAATRCPPMPIVERAVLDASPAVRCRKQKQRGGKSTMKPMALSERQRISLGLRWIRDAADAKKVPGKTLEERLAREMIAIVKGTSSVLEKKRKMHEEAMANRGLLSKRG
ncbi:ribosomal protein S7 [Pholiota conissans]|uniref:Ribosomal protein S7 n=1 Tax=Pholiota conissans TaxID=109636 RepID=A0A9P5Z4L7_9AGAR|nr:ribosomal protein S7 [Pholiota conissans]